MYFSQSGGREVHILLLADLVSGEDSLPGLLMAALLLCPHVGERESFGVGPFSYKDTSLTGLGLHLI